MKLGNNCCMIGKGNTSSARQGDTNRDYVGIINTKNKFYEDSTQKSYLVRSQQHRRSMPSAEVKDLEKAMMC